PGPRQGGANLGELVDGAAGLLHVIQGPAAGEGADGGDGLVGGPPAVGVDADARGDAPFLEPGADGVDAGDVVGEALAAFGHLDFDGGAAGVALEEAVDGLRVGGNVDGGDGGVNLHRAGQRRRRGAPAELQGAAQPPRRLLRAVLREGRPFDPAPGASKSMASRTFTPRKVVRNGRATTRARSRRSRRSGKSL